LAGDDELLKDANSWYSAAQLEEIERQKQEDAQVIWQVYFRLKGGDDISDEKIEALGQVYNRLMKQTPTPQKREE
jgi:hypothetical protein